jgi:hypothetical protein
VPTKSLEAVEHFFSTIRSVRKLGAGTKERSYYPALTELLNSIGGQLKPKVLCVSDLENTGAGHPDFGLFAANQIQKGEPKKGQKPERGVIEMKGLADDAWVTTDTTQVTKYFGAYRLVIVTNMRDFLIVGEDHEGKAIRLESYKLAPDAKVFWEKVNDPKGFAEELGQTFAEFLMRALTQSVALRSPKDVAWFLASYARDALRRVDDAGDLPALKAIRSSLEEALRVTFDKERGIHFFRSTLVQTLFYGVFSAWVLWARQPHKKSDKFDWRSSIWHITVPFIRSLFQQIASPSHLNALNLVEVLDWTASALNRVDQAEFFKSINDEDAVQYFYEPFLEAFDPELRKELGVWYTPIEVVDYMVARVDKALRDDLGIEDGLAANHVYILDPCCGTGAFLASVLRQIDKTFETKGYGALKGQKLKQAALSRVFGFEIMPAPFVVAHLQVGLSLKALGASLDSTSDRPGIFLTNALTGWEPETTKPLPFPELEEEREKSDKVKQATPILVILGNPPYNGYAGMAVQEERALSTAYRTPKKVRKPQGQGLNDLYVRFYRMAERRIAEKTGQGIICFITNYSWLDGLSFTAMRERFLDAFDDIRIDSLNGDKYRTGKTTPDGLPDPSVFSTDHNREGIQVGTAIATLIRRVTGPSATTTIGFRNIWGASKRQQLLDTKDEEPNKLYQVFSPALALGLPFSSANAGSAYLSWPTLQQLMPSSYAGVKTSRDEFVIDIEREALIKRISAYFDPNVSNDSIRSRYPISMVSTSAFPAETSREFLVKRGFKPSNVVRYAYRPFDIRWLYWEPETALLDRKRPDYWAQLFPNNLFLEAREKEPKETFNRGTVVSGLADNFGNGLSTFFPAFVGDGVSPKAKPNLRKSILGIVSEMDAAAGAVFFHAVAMLHSPKYRSENADALRMDWPRVPILPSGSNLDESVRLGKLVTSLVNPDSKAEGISGGKMRSELASLGVIAKVSAGVLSDSDLAMTCGWGSTQNSGGGTIVMPGRGLLKNRDYSPAELENLDKDAKYHGLDRATALSLIGAKTFDVFLNTDVCWKNVPELVWNYLLGGHQPLKKWLSYREKDILGRALFVDEASYFSEMVRRITTILLLSKKLDANYDACKSNAIEWTDEGAG